jgi:hypothetical protein
MVRERYSDVRTFTGRMHVIIRSRQVLRVTITLVREHVWY